MHRFFIPREWFDGDRVNLGEEPARQIINVLRLQPGDHRREGAGAQQPTGETMHAVGDGVARATVLDQAAQLLLQCRVLVTQYQDLAFHERDRGAAALMRQFQAGEHARVPLEELRVRKQVLDDLLLRDATRLDMRE